MVVFSMGDKRSENGSLLIYEVVLMTADMSVQLTQGLRKLRAFQILSNSLKNDRVNLYFEKYFYYQVLSTMTKLAIFKWHKRNKTPFDATEIEIPNFPWLELFQKAWPDPSIPYRVNRYLVPLQNMHSRESKSLTVLLKKNCRHLLSKIPLELKVYSLRFILDNPLETIKYVSKAFFSRNRSSIKAGSDQNFVIAVNYAEGVNPEKRSDIFWYSGSEIEPSKVLICFEVSGALNRYDKPKNVIRTVENVGFKWSALKLLDIHVKDKVWRYKNHLSCPALEEIKTRLKKLDPVNSVEEWLIDEILVLIREINYWHAFFADNNVRIYYDVTESGQDNIIKNIALDLLGGCSIGKERSVLCNHKGLHLGYYPNSIFFTWGKQSAERLLNTNNSKDNVLISGFPYGSNFGEIKKSSLELKQKLFKKGARFIVCLLDNMHNMNRSLGQNIYTPYLVKFYKVFLNWALEDKNVGLIIKSKKPVVLENLPEIRPLLIQAEDTGRCYRLPDELGTQPSLAGFASDMAVSIGNTLSSALIEVVLTGTRGIYYDCTNLRPYEGKLYEWGHEKVIFDDIDKMMEALKRFKENPDSEPEVGDWSSHIDELDPFRDGRGADRIGTYMRWLLEGFNKGRSRDEAVEEANKLYADMWGGDKIMRGV